MTIPAGLLWHYTGQAGLLGTLGGRVPTLRLSSAIHSNDRGEMSMPTRLLQQAVQVWRAENRAELEKSRPAWGEEMLRWVMRRDFIKSVDTLPSRYGHDGWPQLMPFIFCMSSVENDLSQWRAYGQDSGRFAIGFDPERLKAWAEKTQPKLAVKEVLYLTEAQCREQIEARRQELLEASYPRMITPQMRGLPADQVDGAKYSYEAHALSAMSGGPAFRPWFGEWAAQVKSRDFHLENETRLLVMPQIGEITPHFAQGANSVKPYIEFPLVADGWADGRFTSKDAADAFPVRAIMVGPCRDQDLNLISARMLVARFRQSGEGVAVAHSQTALR